MHKRNFLDNPDEALHRLTLVGGFQDVSEACRSIRVLRHDVAGVTLYAKTGIGTNREPWQDTGAYVVAYESEIESHTELKQVIIETDNPSAIWMLLELIDCHTVRIEREIQLRLVADNASRQFDTNTIDSPSALSLKTISRFDDDDMRASIEQSLARLSDIRLENAYAGFVNAVHSKVDDWLMSRSFTEDEPLVGDL